VSLVDTVCRQTSWVTLLFDGGLLVARGDVNVSVVSNLIDKIVERLYRREVAFSRNKNFEAYRDPNVRRAARIYRHLKSVEADLLAHGETGTVELVLESRDDRAARIRLSIESLECKRTAYLRPFELALLRENPQLDALLARAA